MSATRWGPIFDSASGRRKHPETNEPSRPGMTL
jgi:hypothetical protein